MPKQDTKHFLFIYLFSGLAQEFFFNLYCSYVENEHT